MGLTYRYGKGNIVAWFYKGASDDSITHTRRLEDGSKLQIHDSNLQLIYQPDLSKLPKTPLGHSNEVGTCLILVESQSLAWPRTLHPLQQDIISWNHRIYHLPFCILLILASTGFLPKRLLGFRNKSPLCIACQFGAAHRCPWQTKGKKSGSIRRPDQTNPRDGVSVDHIFSAQTNVIPQISGFINSQIFWGCTTFVDHVSD